MKQLAILAMTSLVATLLACGEPKGEAGTSGTGDVGTEDVGTAVDRQVSEQTGTQPANSAAPCEILDDALLRTALDLPPEVEISRSPSRHSPNPLCTASWEKPNAEELQRQRTAAISEYAQKVARGEKAEMPSLRTANEVSLTLYGRPFDSPQEAQRAFDGAMKRLAGGITGSHEDVEITLQADLTPVAGVGDKAMWAAKMRQLSVVDGAHIFHVKVDTDREPAAELASAKTIAAQVVDEL